LRIYIKYFNQKNKILNNIYINNLTLKNSYNTQITFKKKNMYINISKNIKNCDYINFISYSLGMFIKFFKSKKLKKKKILYIISIKLLSRFLKFLKISKLVLTFLRKIKYLINILSILNSKENKLYNNPFTKTEYNEKLNLNYLHIIYIFFKNYKYFGTRKTRKKGRIKRKILKKITKINSILD